MIDRLRQFVASDVFSRLIVGVIIFNAVILGMQTSEHLMAKHGALLNALDWLAIYIFTIEIALRIVLLPRRSIRSGWFWFDFAVVAVSWVPTGGSLSVLRALRLFRVLRLVSILPSLRRTVTGLMGALPGMGSVILLLSLVFYVSGVMATSLFGDAFPEWFGTLGASLYSLFQIMTLESWSMGIVRPVLEVFPWAWVFFVPFIVVTSFAVLNMFIGVIVSSIEEDVEEERQVQMEAMEARLGEQLSRLEALITQQSTGAVPDTPAAASTPATPHSS